MFIFQLVRMKSTFLGIRLVVYINTATQQLKALH